MLERRTLRLSVSQEILPLTFLVGTEFVKARLEAMKCMSLFVSLLLLTDAQNLRST